MWRPLDYRAPADAEAARECSPDKEEGPPPWWPLLYRAPVDEAAAREYSPEKAEGPPPW